MRKNVTRPSSLSWARELARNLDRNVKMKNVRDGSRLKEHARMKIKRSEAGIPDFVGSIDRRLSDRKCCGKLMCV